MSKPLVHLVNPMKNSGGSEWRTIELYRLLRETCDVRVWSTEAVAPRLAGEAPLQAMDIAMDYFPRGGCLVIVGSYFALGKWVFRTQPERIVLVYNISHLDWLSIVRAQLQKVGPPVEMVFASQLLMRESGLAGVVQVSPIDLSRFAPKAEGPGPARPFTVGRVSRDALTKHHQPDVALYRSLAAQGCHVRIMGGTVLSEALAGVAGVELLPGDAMPAEEFLHGLDCFYYRTSEGFVESFGRVVMEAMACGVPVVAHRRGGYAEYMTDGLDCFLVDDASEALARIMALKSDPALAARVGRAARARIERTYSPTELEKIAAFYRGE